MPMRYGRKETLNSKEGRMDFSEQIMYARRYDYEKLARQKYGAIQVARIKVKALSLTIIKG